MLVASCGKRPRTFKKFLYSSHSPTNMVARLMKDKHSLFVHGEQRKPLFTITRSNEQNSNVLLISNSEASPMNLFRFPLADDLLFSSCQVISDKY